jgi:hypothetical protein
VIANSAINGNGTGVFAYSNARIAIADCVFTGNNNGVEANAGAEYSFSEVNLDRCAFSRNLVAIHSGATSNQSQLALVRLANCHITGNDQGVSALADGPVLSRISNGVLTNTIEGNGIDASGSFGTYSAQ